MSGVNESDVFSYVVFLTNISKNICCCFFSWDWRSNWSLLVVIVILVSFVAHIDLFVTETVIPAVVFAVPTFES